MEQQIRVTLDRCTRFRQIPLTSILFVGVACGALLSRVGTSVLRER